MVEKIEKSIKGGKRAGAGRKAGVPNKLTREVKQMILDALEQAGGVTYLTKQATANPTAFLTLLGKVLPLQVTGDPDNPLGVVVTVKDYTGRKSDGRGAK